MSFGLVPIFGSNVDANGKFGNRLNSGTSALENTVYHLLIASVQRDGETVLVSVHRNYPSVPGLWRRIETRLSRKRDVHIVRSAQRSAVATREW